jgi:hypothetical protein
MDCPIVDKASFQHFFAHAPQTEQRDRSRMCPPSSVIEWTLFGQAATHLPQPEHFDLKYES